MTVWFATGNTHKKKELASILEEAIQAGNGAAAPLFSARELKIPADAGLAFDPIESGSSFRENALIKALELHTLLNNTDRFNSGDAVIADDSGLCVDALDGRPGIYSARYAGPPGTEARTPLCDTDRNALLLAELEGNLRRNARFVCAMVLLFSPDNFYIAQETLEGSIIESPRGTGGFGYDPLLFIPELGRTVAELAEPEKNRISHRGKAGRVIGRMLYETIFIKE